MLAAAEASGCRQALVDALHTDVLAACVGPVTAAPLDRLRVPVIIPGRARLGLLVRELCIQLPTRRCRVLTAAGHRLELRGSAVIVDGQLVRLPPAPQAMLRALATQPGRVLSREDLQPALPRQGSNTHAVEMAVIRLRALLGDPQIVTTVAKRGYRLAYQAT